MEQVLLIGALILLYTLQSLFSRMYTDKYPGDKSYAPSAFAIVCGLTVAVVSLCFCGFSFGEFRWETLVFGIINAVILYCYDEFIIKASAAGDYSIMMVFNIGGGIIIPSVVSMIFFGAPFSWVQMVAIAVIFVAIYMVIYKNESGATDGSKKNTKLFFILCIALAISNGMYGVLLNWQEYSYTGGVSDVINLDKQLMVIYTFIGAAVISGVRLLIKRGKDSLSVFRQSKLSCLYLILASVVSALAVNVLVLLIGIVNITVLYTFDNAGVMLLSALASAVIFKEKLTRVNIIGCIIMAIGLVLMGGAASIELFFATGSFVPAA